MVNETSSHDVSESFGKNPQFDFKVDVDLGAKRDGEELEEDSDVSQKRAKMRDLQSVLQSEGIATYDPATSKMEENEEHMDIIETQGSQTVDKNAIEHANTGLSEGAPKKSSVLCGSKPLDLNSDLCTDENSGYNDNVVSLGDSSKQALYGKGKAVSEFDRTSLSGSLLNFSTEEVTSSANHDLFTSRSHNNLKVRETLSCGKTSGSLEEKDALRKWKEMKQNGFMSSSYGGIPPPPPAAAPKQRGRKSKSEVLKQKMEQAKKEQVDRFAKIAAPSGLLNGLNPGIINHVRNSKQVHSIIQALVRSEKQESLKQASGIKDASQDLPGKHLGQENACYSGSLLLESMQLRENRLLHGGSSLFDLGDKGGHGESIAKGRGFPSQTHLASHSNNYSDNDILALKLASSNMVSESTSCLSNDESASVDTLSVKAATVASQWLQLLHQDIKGRLSALRRSKKRVNAVITTELPFLLSKEFESNQENDLSIAKDPVTGCSNKAAAELHQTQWNKLFNQMDTSLSEEEKQLECWLNEVNHMLQLCDKGLQHVQCNMAFEMQRLGAFNNNFRSKIIDPEKDLPVRAAAASIYSTGNYANSRENVSCC